MSILDKTYTCQSVEAKFQPGRCAEIRLWSGISDGNTLKGDLSIRVHAIDQGDATISFFLTDPALARQISVMLAEHARRLEELAEEANYLRNQGELSQFETAEAA